MNRGAVLAIVGVGVFAIAASALAKPPGIPPMPGPVPPIPPAPPGRPTPAPIPNADPGTVFIEPAAPAGNKSNAPRVAPRTVLDVGRVVQLRGIDSQLYQIVEVQSSDPTLQHVDSYTGQAVDPVAFDAGRLVGMPNFVSFVDGDVVAIIQ